MKKITITIETTNAAFETPDIEVARILKELAVYLENDGSSTPETVYLRDINGNTVGSAVTK